MADSPSNDIRLIPGGVVTSKPPHLVGLRGATPYIAQPLNLDGFLNLICLNEETAVPFANRSTDNDSVVGSLLLGGTAVGGVDTVDVARQSLLGQLFHFPVNTGTVPAIPVFNSEVMKTSTAAMIYGAYFEPFTTAGTVTVTVNDPTILGVGTTWTADVLTNAYTSTARKSLNFIDRGDLIGIDNGAGGRNWFRIIDVTDDTHLEVFPTPTVGNGAIGAGKAYIIIRTGYGGYSRGIAFKDPSGGTSVFVYYCGNSHNIQAAGDQAGHGIIEAIQTNGVSGQDHYMAPKTVDALGAETAFYPRADDIIFYKGFLLYGAGGAISWSVAGFPGGSPFQDTDFPAANISIIDSPGKFVSFEQLGDQVVAHFEESHWLVVNTGTVPEFNFYRLPEVIGVQHPAAAEPCGMNDPLQAGANSVYGRPSCSGRGAIFFASNRGIEQLSGGLSEEASAPISNRLPTAFTGGPGQLTTLFLSWSDDFDLLWMRPAWGESNRVLIFNPGLGDWSTFEFAPTQGRSVVGITGGVPAWSRQSDGARYYHMGYYETLDDSGTPGVDGGLSQVSTNSPDAAIFSSGTVPWKWRTATTPLGLRYPDYSLGGFIMDIITAGGLSAINWKVWASESPYNLVLYDSGTLTIPAVSGAAIFGTHWTSSRVRLSKKCDASFVAVEISSLQWAQIGGILLFNANTQAKR